MVWRYHFHLMVWGYDFLSFLFFIEIVCPNSKILRNIKNSKILRNIKIVKNKIKNFI